MNPRFLVWASRGLLALTVETGSKSEGSSLWTKMRLCLIGCTMGKKQFLCCKASPGESTFSLLPFFPFFSSLLFAALLQKYLGWLTTVMHLGAISICGVGKIARVEKIPHPNG